MYIVQGLSPHPLSKTMTQIKKLHFTSNSEIQEVNDRRQRINKSLNNILEKLDDIGNIFEEEFEVVNKRLENIKDNIS